MLATKGEKLMGDWSNDTIVEGFLVGKKIYFGQFQH